MAYSLNQVTLLGNVGSDPEIKQFSDGYTPQKQEECRDDFFLLKNKL